MILSFKKQFPWNEPTNFKQKILDGTKIHTFREDPHGRWKAGKKIHHAHGVRTKNYDCFLENVCVSTQPAIINHYPGGLLEVIIDGDLAFRRVGAISLNTEVMEKIAINDGFNNYEDFFKWFSSDFRGVIIHWTDFRY